MTLHPATFLQGGKYQIEKVLGQGGFGITYLGLQVELNRRVAIKEFFMKEYCNRNADTSHVSIGTEGSRDLVQRFMKKFVKEAQTIAALTNAHIIRIYDIFHENGTAYYVMEYLDGGSLSEYLARKGALDQDEALRYIRQVGDALRYLHARRMNHLDVKPGNIMLNGDGEAVLIDFGLSKRYDAEGHQTSTTPVGISHGYAPAEQYRVNGVGTFSPTTDIYSLAATLYKLLTGITPPEATAISVDEDLLQPLPGKFAAGVRRAVACGLKSKQKERPQSVDEFLCMLSGEGVPMTGADEETHVDEGHDDSEETIPGPDGAALKGGSGSSGKPAGGGASAGGDASGSGSSSGSSGGSSADGGDSSPLKKYLWPCVAAVLCVLLVFIGFKSCGEQEYEPEPTPVIIEEESNDVMNDSIASSAVQQKPTGSSLSFTANGVTFKMMPVAAGSFMMGATSEQKEPWDDEKPVHRVTLTKDYYMGETEVTQALWRAVMGSNPSNFKGNNRPVEQVSWNDCQTFIRKLNSLLAGRLPSGKSFRLPTEAEWEFAARGGNRSNKYQYSGSNNLSSVAWYGDSNGSTHDVKGKSPNELGLYDMSGNVWEWCNDYWGDYTSSSQTDPSGPSSGPYRVDRGGSWNNDAGYCRVALRNSCTPASRNNNLGLRLAL